MAPTNKFGLSRNVPEAVKRQIRQESGFGCVVCGNAMYTYEHIDPLFSEAKVHDPECMTLLCNQCQGKVTRGFLSKETVWKAKLNPKTKQKGFTFGAFDIGSNPPKVHFGSNVAENFRYAITLDDRPVLSIEAPEEDGGPFRINAKFWNSTGEIVASIENNEWTAQSDNWDVEVIGQRIKIRSGPGKFALVLKTVPPNELWVEHLDMFVQNFTIKCDGDTLEILDPKGRGRVFGGNHFKDRPSVIRLGSDGYVSCDH